MDCVHAFLRERLGGLKSLAVLGVGSVLRGDDAAGMLLLDRLDEAFPRRKHPRLLLCPGETAPENYSGKIRDFQPSHLLIVDAADLNKQPGEIVDIPPRDVGGPTYCSHMLPIRVMVDYIADGVPDMDVTLLGIQYESIAFDGEMTKKVSAAVEEIFQALREIIAKSL